MITYQQAQWMVERDIEHHDYSHAIFNNWGKGSPDVDKIWKLIGQSNETRRKLELEFLLQYPYWEWLWNRCPYWIAVGIASEIRDGSEVTDANQLATLCGMEPRPYFSPREIVFIMRGILAGGRDVKPDEVLLDDSEIIESKYIRKLGEVLERHPAVFGQKDRIWQDVYRWATSEKFKLILRRICLRYADHIVTDVTSPYRRIFYETLEQPYVATLPSEFKQERAKAAAVRAFLSEFYYQINPGIPVRSAEEVPAESIGENTD